MGKVRGERRVEVGCDWMRWLFGVMSRLSKTVLIRILRQEPTKLLYKPLDLMAD